MGAGNSRNSGAVLAMVLLGVMAVLGSRAVASGMPPLGVRGGLGLDAGLVGSGAESAAEGAPVVAASAGQRYFLRLHHTHTEEDISIVYRIGNTYLPEAMDKLNYFFA